MFCSRFFHPNYILPRLMLKLVSDLKHLSGDNRLCNSGNFPGNGNKPPEIQDVLSKPKSTVYADRQMRIHGTSTSLLF